MSENPLAALRLEIDEIDNEMAVLFQRRMDVSRRVALYKQETGMPIFDSDREKAVLARGAMRIKEEDLRAHYVNFLQSTMDVSKAYQARLLHGMQVAYAGVKGAFAELAARRIFPDANAVGYATFEEAYRAVEEGACDVAVLPLENSINGDVGRVMDLAFFGSLYVNGIYDAVVVQNLLGRRGASLKEIRRVISHPQALGQCAPFLRERGFALQEAENTAEAARRVAESDDRTLAAVGSAEAAAEYGLDILAAHINEKEGNTTRFAVFSRVAKEQDERDGQFLMAFTVKNEAGALAKAVSAIGKAQINLRAIKSRPTKHLSWEYYFLLEGEGNLHSENGKRMLLHLQENCNNLKILGQFEKEREI